MPLWTAIETVSTLGLQARLRGDAGIRDVYDRAAHPHIVGHALAAAGVGALPLVDLVGRAGGAGQVAARSGLVVRQDWNGRMASEFLGLLGAGIGIGYLARTLGRSN